MNLIKTFQIGGVEVVALRSIADGKPVIDFTFVAEVDGDGILKSGFQSEYKTSNKRNKVFEELSDDEITKVVGKLPVFQDLI